MSFINKCELGEFSGWGLTDSYTTPGQMEAILKRLQQGFVTTVPTMFWLEECGQLPVEVHGSIDQFIDTQDSGDLWLEFPAGAIHVQLRLDHYQARFDGHHEDVLDGVEVWFHDIDGLLVITVLDN